MDLTRLITIIFFSLALIFTVVFPNPASATEKGKSFNDFVLQVIDTYPTDGSHPYAWVNEPGYFGITRDLHYNGEIFISGDLQKRSYCSGITFEVFFQAYLLYNEANDLNQIGQLETIEEMEDFRLKWYGVGGDRRTIKHALEFTGLGYEVSDLSQVEKGDFVQLWRHNGSGHTVVFIEWVKNLNNEIIGLNYWSSNSRQGVGYRVEYFGTSGSGIIMEESYFMKVIQAKVD